jgi:hypothetical protein
MSTSARISQIDHERLLAHLFHGDDEHAAFLYAGRMDAPGGDTRLLIRDVVPVPDEQFGPSDRGGYRQVAAPAVARAAMHCEERGLHLLWAHSHPSATDHVAFSRPDLVTHQRAHPGLITLSGGTAITSLVFGRNAVAGEVWHPEGFVEPLSHLDVVGARCQRLTAAPRPVGRAGTRFARQVLMFGPAGQRALREMTVAVLGAGGGGSLLIQGLAHLGVGRIMIIDFDVVSISNLSRIVGATPADARRRRLKVDVMRRLVANIDRSIVVEAIVGDIGYTAEARRIAEADFLFGATDTMTARFALNAISHTFLVPAIQVGAKIVADPTTGQVELAYAMERPIDFSGGCLECAGAIDAAALHAEQLNAEARTAQRYVDEPNAPIVDPSVISLNSLATSMALTDFQLAATGVAPIGARLTHRVHHALERVVRERNVGVRSGCRWCDRRAEHSLLGAGDSAPLPLHPGHSPHANTLLARAKSRCGAIWR